MQNKMLGSAKIPLKMDSGLVEEDFPDPIYKFPHPHLQKLKVLEKDS